MLAIEGMQEDKSVMDVFALPQCFSSPNGLQRCATGDTGYLSSDFVSKTHNGYGNLVGNLIRSARRFVADVNKTVDHSANRIHHPSADSADDFWFLWEIPLMEGEAGAYSALTAATTTLNDHFASGKIAANVTYAISLVATLIIFFWVFGSVRRSIQQETKYNRGGKLFLYRLNLKCYTWFLMMS